MKLATEYATFVVGVSKDGVQQGMVYCHVKDDKRGIVSWLTATEAQELASALLEATGAEAVILPRGITPADFGEDNSLARMANDPAVQDDMSRIAYDFEDSSDEAL